MHGTRATLTVLLGTLLLGGPAHALQPMPDTPQGWKIGLEGQYRPRLIIDSGRDLVDDTFAENEYVTHRARLGITAQSVKGMTLTLRVQDVRVWGEERHTLHDATANGFDAHEAFLVLPIMEGVSIKLGRQEIIFDNARLVGNVGWTQRAQSFDGGRAMWRSPSFDADLLMTVVSENDQDPDGATANPKEVLFGGAHGTLKLSPALTASFSLLHRRNKDVETRTTAGVMVQGKAAGAHYSGELYRQLGDLGEESISAMLVALRAGYTLETTLKPTVTVWGEYLSGSADGKRHEVFNTLYATNHKFYGEMDFFLAAPVLGLMDVGGRLAVKATEAVSAHVDFHRLATVEEDADGNKDLGNEIDLKLVWKANPNLAFRALYGIFLPGDAAMFKQGGALLPVDDPKTEHFIYITTDARF